MVSSKLLELENAVNNLSMEEKIWLLEKIVVQMRELTKVANWQVELNREQGNLNANSEDDPLIGLFAGSPDLATNSEEILREEIKDKSGWTYKEMPAAISVLPLSYIGTFVNLLGKPLNLRFYLNWGWWRFAFFLSEERWPQTKLK